MSLLYPTITADPPWRYDDSGVRGGTKKHYKTMSMLQIYAMPVEQLAHRNAHLYLWTTNSFLPQALTVCQVWGFRYVTTLTWVKKGNIGTGHYFRGTTEHVIFGVRGRAPLRVHNLPTHFEAPRGLHSAKPDRFFQIVGEASRGPYLELFARGTTREGWDQWGNEVQRPVVLPLVERVVAA